MIKNWKLVNFKSIQNKTELVFAPLTIFAGANSSGKSTLLQSILLVAQTLSHKISSRSVVLNGDLVRLGQFNDLKSAKNIADQNNAENTDDQIVIGWTFHQQDIPESRMLGLRRMVYFPMRNRQMLKDVSCTIAFDAKDPGAQSEIAQIQPTLFSLDLSVSTQESKTDDRHYFMKIQRTPIANNTLKQKWIDVANKDELMARHNFQYDVEIDKDLLKNIREEWISAEPVNCLLRHFLPEYLLLGVDMMAENAQSIINILTEGGKHSFSRKPFIDRVIVVPEPVINFVLNIANELESGDSTTNSKLSQILEKLKEQNPSNDNTIFLETLSLALRSLYPPIRNGIREKLLDSDEFERIVKDSIRNTMKEQREQLEIVPFRPPSPIAEASLYLDQFFTTSVRYLGPLRDEPKPLYPLLPTIDPSNVGLKGEHTAAVLELYKNLIIQYIPASSFEKSEIMINPINSTLESAVADWLRYLGVAENVRSQDKGKFGHELKVNIDRNEPAYDLTHVGVGVSQVLPILVASLLAVPGTTLIFEQPELHLHPKVQTLLADFFLSMTQLGKQCLLETHSEYLINRIRFRTAAAIKANPWIQDVKLYFVEKKKQGSSFKEVNINEYGAILDWPEGFFDQSQQEAEAILRAATNKRKISKEK